MPLLFYQLFFPDARKMQWTESTRTGHTQSVAARFILTDVITSTAFSNAGGDFNTYLSAYIEYEVGVDNQLYYAETRESELTSSSTFNNTWNGLYSTLKSARIIINQCSEEA